MVEKRKGEIFILTVEPLSRLGGLERFLNYLSEGFKQQGYEVRVFHRQNCAPQAFRHPNPARKGQWFLNGSLLGYFIGQAVKQHLHSEVRLIISNSVVGYLPVGNGVKRAHFYHGTYRGQAEAIRQAIHYRGYLKLKWWDAMVLERLSGKGKTVLCCSEAIRQEVRRFFGYEGHVMWYPIDLGHFRSLDQADCRKKLGLSGSQPAGLFVGSTQPMKGFSTVDHLIGAFPKVMWLLALRGEAPKRLSGLPNVRVFQNATYELLPTLYNAADFSLCPSRYDPFPYVVSEALACGLPVIASPHGASLTYHKDSVLQPLLASSTDDWRGFDEAVRLVLSDPVKWRTTVQEQVRPRLSEMMAPENWWPRFLSVLEM